MRLKIIPRPSILIVEFAHQDQFSKLIVMEKLDVKLVPQVKLKINMHNNVSDAKQDLICKRV